MVNQGEARARFGEEFVERMGYWLTRTDPLADEVIAATRGWPRVRLLRTVEQAIRHGIEAVDQPPEPLEALIDQVTTLPAWVDRQRIDRGGAFFLSTHILGGLVLGAKSLIAGYAAPAGNKPLVLSGRLRQGTNRRLAETSRFVYDVSNPGGLEKGGDGVVSAVTVRLIHAQVRDMIERKADWRADWGAPINQHDMMATLLLFSVIWLEGIETLGVIPTDRESDDLIALWRYVGYLMGVDPELLPATRREAQRYAGFVELTQAAPDEDSRQLTRAFMSAGPSEAEAGRGAARRQALGCALVRTLLGDELADDLGVPDSSWSNAIPVVGQMARPLNAVRQIPGGARAATDIGHRYWQWVLQNNPAGLVDLTIPEELFGLGREAA
jgi:hypothetical protein